MNIAVQIAGCIYPILQHRAEVCAQVYNLRIDENQQYIFSSTFVGKFPGVFWRTLHQTTQNPEASVRETSRDNENGRMLFNQIQTKMQRDPEFAVARGESVPGACATINQLRHTGHSVSLITTSQLPVNSMQAWLTDNGLDDLTQIAPSDLSPFRLLQIADVPHAVVLAEQKQALALAQSFSPLDVPPEIIHFDMHKSTPMRSGIHAAHDWRQIVAYGRQAEARINDTIAEAAAKVSSTFAKP